jgi:2-iminobutanoate/2-iminopropanoate deaminase
MSSEFESTNTGIAAHIGKYADAVQIPAGAEVVYQAWHNVEDALSLAGAALTDIDSVRQWLTDAADIPAYAKVRSSVIKHEPVFMLAVIPALVWPNIRVEVEVIAVRQPAA